MALAGSSKPGLSLETDLVLEVSTAFTAPPSSTDPPTPTPYPTLPYLRSNARLRRDL